MKTFHQILFAALVGLLAVLDVDGAVLYRGRLSQSIRGETHFDDGASYAMVFRLYHEPQGGEPFYTTPPRSVAVGSDGSFEIVLDDPAIDAVFMKNASAAVYIALSLDGERELMPRRQILMLPKTARAKSTDRLAENARIGSFHAHGVTTDGASVHTLKADRLSTKSSPGALSMQGVTSRDLRPDALLHKRLSLLGETKTLVAGIQPTSIGQTLCTAPADGIALIVSGSSAKCPGVIRLCRAGDAIVAPTVGTELKVCFHSFIIR